MFTYDDYCDVMATACKSSVQHGELEVNVPTYDNMLPWLHPYPSLANLIGQLVTIANLP